SHDEAEGGLEEGVLAHEVQANTQRPADRDHDRPVPVRRVGTRDDDGALHGGNVADGLPTEGLEECSPEEFFHGEWMRGEGRSSVAEKAERPVDRYSPADEAVTSRVARGVVVRVGPEARASGATNMNDVALEGHGLMPAASVRDLELDLAARLAA